MRKFLDRSYMAIVFVFLFAPIIILMFFSFNEGRSNVIFTGFSLQWYKELFSDSKILNALVNTLVIALLSALISTVIGTAAALGINNLKKWRKSLIMNVTYIPVLNPDIITGVSLMLMFVAFSLPTGFLTVLLAHITFNIPYVILAVMPKLRQVDQHLYEAAQDLGATPITAFFKAVFPQLLPGIFSGLLMAFTLSIDDFVITFFVRGNAFNTLSTIIYTTTKRKIPLTINALCTLMFITVLLILIVVNLPKRKSKKQEVRI